MTSIEAAPVVSFRSSRRLWASRNRRSGAVRPTVPSQDALSSRPVSAIGGRLQRGRSCGLRGVNRDGLFRNFPRVNLVVGVHGVLNHRQGDGVVSLPAEAHEVSRFGVVKFRQRVRLALEGQRIVVGGVLVALGGANVLMLAGSRERCVDVVGLGHFLSPVIKVEQFQPYNSIIQEFKGKSSLKVYNSE